MYLSASSWRGGSMARFSCTGYDELNAAYAELQDIPQAVTGGVLEAMGEVAMERVRETGEAMGVRDPKSNEHILDKLKLSKPVYTKDGGYLRVTYSGSRLRGKTKTQNSEIAYINEFGKRGQPARPFMKTALRQHEDEIAEAGAAKLSAWQKSIFEK